MAAVPQYLALSSPLNTHVSLSSPALAPFAHMKIGSLSGFSSLKVQIPSIQSFASLGSRNLRSFRQRGRIVCKAQETSLDIPTVTDATWESLVLKAEGPVLVEFWATWCGPCRMLHPVIGELSKEYVGRVKCYKLSTDDSPSVTNQYGIRSIPTIMIFVNGDNKDAIVGAVPKTTLTNTLDKYL